MGMEELYPAIFTLFQLCWAFVWAVKHVRVRRRRRYADGRARADKNSRYKVVRYFLFVAQNVICVASFWLHSQLLLEVHDSNSMRVAGATITCLATFLYFGSLSYLGRNYSPCFDSHVPLELVSAGPYRFARHPM